MGFRTNLRLQDMGYCNRGISLTDKLCRQSLLHHVDNLHQKAAFKRPKRFWTCNKCNFPVTIFFDLKRSVIALIFFTVGFFFIDLSRVVILKAILKVRQNQFCDITSKQCKGFNATDVFFNVSVF